MGFKMIFKSQTLLVLSIALIVSVKAAQISEADLLALTKQEVDDESERLFEYVKTSSDGTRLGCKGKVGKGETAKVQALFIEDAAGRREIRRLAPVTAKVRNFLNQEEDKYVPLREFPRYCLDRVFRSASCPPGPAGRAGRDGRNGTQGVTGLVGQSGKPGIPGLDGAQGPQGPPGGVGLAGPSGDIGDTGLAGEPGPKGPKGIRGPDGKDGAVGSTGAPGTAGNPGTPGPNGLDGVDGVDGGPGAPGLDGLPGLPGPNGLNGISGLAGNNGANGFDGTNGQNGVAGTPGPDGHCGCDGPRDLDSDNCLASELIEEEEEPQITESVKADPPKLAQTTTSFWVTNNDLLYSHGDFKNKNKNKLADVPETMVEIEPELVDVDLVGDSVLLEPESKTEEVLAAIVSKVDADNELPVTK
ncbi:unnamed protein product [Orchesella dallaii]|uniref:Uncharacterized protein n=1 Tax=Orchesella dallaii TaxID=48710 RepID=A0ABP1QL96_9HEXA